MKVSKFYTVSNIHMINIVCAIKVMLKQGAWPANHLTVPWESAVF